MTRWPCAKLTMFMTPKTMLNPAAMSAYAAPISKPLAADCSSVSSGRFMPSPWYAARVSPLNERLADLRQVGDLAGLDVGDQRLDLFLVLGAEAILELAEAGEADAVLVEPQQVIARLQ